MQTMKFIVRRLLAAGIVLILVSIVVFLLLQLAGGDAARAAAGGVEASAEDIERARERLGLNDPVVIQYLNWSWSLLQGDLGTSMVNSQDVSSVIGARLPVTLSLTAVAIVFGIAIAVPLGVLAAIRRGTKLDRILTSFASVGIATPQFVVALTLILVLSVQFNVFPATGYMSFIANPYQWVVHLILPGLTLGLPLAAELTRHIRASLTDVLKKDYVRAAFAQGIPKRLVIFKFCMKNAAIPIVTVLGLQLANLLGGIVVVETIFSTPGLGLLAVRSVFDRDIPTVQGVTLFVAAIIVIINIAVDLTQKALDPRARLS